MTNEEALRELKDSIKGDGYQCHIETYEMAIEALEKQIPKKPTWTERFKTKGNFSMHVTESWCSNCECEVDKDINNWCPSCGQRLEWE